MAARPGPRTPQTQARPSLTESPLKRTDTRTGSDPPSSRRAASIAGPRPVTSHCHLHGSELRNRCDRDARRRTGKASRARERAVRPASHTPLGPAYYGGGHIDRKLPVAGASGSCSRSCQGPPSSGSGLVFANRLPQPALAPLSARYASPRPSCAHL